MQMTSSCHTCKTKRLLKYTLLRIWRWKVKIDVNVTVRDNTRTYEIDAPNGLSIDQLQYWLGHNLHNATEKKVKNTERVAFSCDFTGKYATTAACDVPIEVVEKGVGAIKGWLANNEQEWEYYGETQVVNTDGMACMPYGLEINGCGIEDIHNGD
jgi:hypothetical protein